MDDTFWLQISRACHDPGSLVTLRQTHRLHTIATGLSCNSSSIQTVFPPLVTVISESNEHSLRHKELLFEKLRINTSKYSHDSQANSESSTSTSINLHLGSSNNRTRVLIADCNLARFHSETVNARTGTSTIERNDFIKQYPLRSETATLEDSVIVHRILEPFSDVFCIFTNDLGYAARILMNWMKYSGVSVPACSKPAILILGEVYDANPTINSQLFSTVLSSTLPGLNPKSYFSYISIRNVGRTRQSSSDDKVLSTITGIIEAKVSERQLKHLDFSFFHSVFLFNEIFEHFSTGGALFKPFNFILAARKKKPFDATLFKAHSKEFLGALGKTKIKGGVSIIASALVMDASPPGMHRKYCYINFLIKSAGHRLLSY